MVAKEFAADDYDYDQEQQDIEAEGAETPPQTIGAPLTTPGASGGTPSKPPGISAPAQPEQPQKPSASPGIGTSKPSAVTSQDKRAVNVQR